jgi:hypothetical protein
MNFSASNSTASPRIRWLRPDLFVPSLPRIVTAPLNLESRARRYMTSSLPARNVSSQFCTMLRCSSGGAVISLPRKTRQLLHSVENRGDPTLLPPIAMLPARCYTSHQPPALDVPRRFGYNMKLPWLSRSWILCACYSTPQATVNFLGPLETICLPQSFSTAVPSRLSAIFLPPRTRLKFYQ